MRNFAFALVLATLGCGKNTEPPAASNGSPSSQTESGPRPPPTTTTTTPPTSGDGIPDESRNLFASVCATCHGTDGTGNGPAAGSINPKPRNYTDAAWQASITDEELKKIILLGGQGVGKSPMMPGNPNLRDKPEVIDGLVKIVRQFAMK